MAADSNQTSRRRRGLELTLVAADEWDRRAWEALKRHARPAEGGFNMVLSDAAHHPWAVWTEAVRML